VEVSPEFFAQIGAEVFGRHPLEAVEDIQQLQEQVRHTLREALSINVAVTLLPPGQAPRSEGGKLRRVIDRRVLK
jgi:phenylacetate-CoA ligase